VDALQRDGHDARVALRGAQRGVAPLPCNDRDAE
jgi:hypothetical protein